MKLTICLVAYSTKFTETVSYKQLNNMKSSIKESLNVIIFDNGSINFSSEKSQVVFRLLYIIIIKIMKSVGQE